MSHVKRTKQIQHRKATGPVLVSYLGLTVNPIRLCAPTREG